jgi:hypothetical protein
MCLERIQRRATWYITGLYELDYTARLKICSILPLSLRREFLDLVLMYNIKNDLVDMDIQAVFTSADVDIPVRRFCKTETCFRFFSSRIFHMWNKLPAYIKDTELNASGKNLNFKRILKEWLFNYFFLKFDSNNTCSWILKCRCNNCRLI